MNKIYKIIIAFLIVFGLTNTAHAQATSNFWKLFGTILQPVLNSWSVKAPFFFATSTTATSTFNGDLRFDAELLPDGSTCSNGQILKKTAANDWDCATDSTGGTIDGTGSANTLSYWTDSDTLSATSSPTVGYITATSTTATSTFAGVLGVGTVSPSWKFQVSGLIPSFALTDATGGVNSPHWLLTSSGGNFYLASSSNPLLSSTNFLQIDTSGTTYIGNGATTLLNAASNDTLTLGSGNEAVRILDSGFVGIGTTSPGTILSVSGVGNFAGTGSTLYSTLTAPYFTATSTTATSTFAGGMNVAGSSGLTVLQNGNVGVGTVNAQSKLTVGATKGLSNKLLTVSDRTTPATQAEANGILVDINGGGGIYMTGDNGAVQAKYEAIGGILGIGTMSNTPMSFHTDNTERMRFLNTGNLGIGTTSPNWTLSVAGSGSFDDYVRASYFTATSTTATSTLINTDISQGRVKMHTYPAFAYSTSTAWTATTTIYLSPAYTAETWNGAKCETDVGTVNVSFYDGTNRMNMITASTTIGTFTFSTNNSFNASETRRVDIGTPNSSPTRISCTIDKVINP